MEHKCTFDIDGIIPSSSLLVLKCVKCGKSIVYNYVSGITSNIAAYGDLSNQILPVKKTLDEDELMGMLEEFEMEGF